MPLVPKRCQAMVSCPTAWSCPASRWRAFDTLVTRYLDRFRPVDGVEEAMIEEMAASYWRMRRAWAMKNEMLSSGLDYLPGGDNRSRITASFRQLASSPELALLHRYETHLHLMYQRALHNILLLRTVSSPVAQPEPDSALSRPAGCPVTGLPTQASPSLPNPATARTPVIPNEPSPISGHSPVGRKRDSALPRPTAGTLHTRCHLRGATHPVSRHATNPHSPERIRLNRPSGSRPPASQSGSSTNASARDSRRSECRSARIIWAIRTAKPWRVA